MSPDTPPNDFTALLERWLDDTATPEQAERFWQHMAERPEHARQAAAAVRFETMMAEVIHARGVEEEARRILTVSTPSHTAIARPAPVRRPAGLPRVAAMAAALALLGTLAVLLWPVVPQKGAALARQPAARPSPVPSVPTLSVPPAPQPAALEGPPGDTSAPVAGPSLVERLEGYFIGPIAIQNLPLGQAMALLRGLLPPRDGQGLLDVAALRLTVPAGALSRRVTFHSGEKLPYLKAVRLLAALAGCEVEAAGQAVTLLLLPGVFPPPVEMRTLTDMLAGRLARDGTAALEDATRLEELWADAARLGISVAQDGTALVSRSQWEALRQLTETRDLLAAAPVPAFAVYSVRPDQVPETEDGLLSPEQAGRFRYELDRLKIAPDRTFTPAVSRPDLLTLFPEGAVTHVAPQGNGPGSQNPIVVHTLPNLTVQQSPVYYEVRSSSSSMSFTGTVSAADVAGMVLTTESGQVMVVLPVTSAATTPPAQE